MTFRKTSFLGLLVAGVLAALPSSAAPILLGINGLADVGTTFINFGNPSTGDAFVPYPGYGSFLVSLVNPGIFQTGGVTPGEGGAIQSLNVAVEPPGVTLTPTPGVTAPFMTFNTGGSNLQLYLTMLPLGTLPGSPFTLTDTANGATAAFNANGFVYDTTTKTETPFTGTFSATFNGTTVAQLITSLPVNTPFSATFSATVVPEPVSVLLMGAGLLGVGLISRRKSRRSE